MKRPEQPTKINEIDYRGKTAPALMTGRAVAHPRPPPPPKPSLIPFLSWHSIASRCCYGVDVRLPSHREHIRRDSLKPVTYRSGRVTLVHLNARSSESWRGTTYFIFCLIDKYSGNFLTPKFSQKTMGNFLKNYIQIFPPKKHQIFLDEIFYLYFWNKPWYIIYKLAYLFLIIF